MEEAHPDEGFRKRDQVYKVAIAVCLAALAGSVIYYNMAPRQYTATGTLKKADLNLNDQTAAIKSRIMEAYLLEDAFCKSQDGIDSKNFAYSDANTTVDGMKIHSDIQCHLQDGRVKSFSLDFDQNSQRIIIQEQPQGPSKPT